PAGGIRRCHVAPPSFVAHSAGSNAHPWRSSANRISLTAVACSIPSGAFSVDSGLHVAPPSVERITVVQMPWPQVSEPSIQPWSGEDHVIDWARKPAGIGDEGVPWPNA